MKLTLLLTTALVVLAGAAVAQTATTPSTGGGTLTTPPVQTPSVTPPAVPSQSTGAGGATTPSPNVATAPNDTSPAAKAARKKIEADGYTNVQGLKKGADGMWQATAMRGGSQVQVSVDAKGQVSAK